MAFQKKTWLARLGQGLNKFIFNGGSKVTLDSSPDLVTQEGTPLSAENMNDLEQRIEDEFTNVNSMITSLNGSFYPITFKSGVSAIYQPSGILVTTMGGKHIAFISLGFSGGGASVSGIIGSYDPSVLTSTVVDGAVFQSPNWTHDTFYFNNGYIQILGSGGELGTVSAVVLLD